MSNDNPIEAIVTDRTRARESGDPLADLCFLATADVSGAPRVRTLVLREIVDNRFTLFVNKTSPKWSELDHASEFQMLLFYSTLGRQYRLSGTIEEIAATRLAANWKQRPDISKYLDHFYDEVLPQSSPAPSRDWLLEQIETLRTRAPDPVELEASASATGIDCSITRIDMLDLASDGGLHDRRLYTLAKGIWSTQSLVP